MTILKDAKIKNSAKKGVTLLEVIVSLIIIAIIMMLPFSINLGPSISREAIGGLTAIRTQMRVIQAKSGSFAGNPNVGNIVMGPVIDGAVNRALGFRAGSLTGMYFVDADYRIIAVAANTFRAQATGNSTGARAQSQGIVATIDENGNLVIAGI